MDPLLPLLAHAAVTLYLTGLIWTIQVVHYPLLSQLEGASLRRLHVDHVRRITWVVGPAMVLEAVLNLALLAAPVPLQWSISGLVLLGVIWISTAMVQVPLHGRFGGGERAAGVRLVRTNWVRTAAWSARAAVSLVMLHGAVA